MTDDPSAGITIRPAARSDLKTLLEHRLDMLEAVFPLHEASRGGTGAAGAAAAGGATTGGGLAAAAPGELRAANAEWLERHLGADFEAWLAEIGGEIAGSAAVMWFPHPPTPINPIGLEAYILNVFTEPRWRRRGVARALMNRVVEEARARGIRRIWLRASSDGRPLYEDMGFSESNYLQLVDE